MTLSANVVVDSTRVVNLVIEEIARNILGVFLVEEEL